FIASRPKSNGADPPTSKDVTFPFLNSSRGDLAGDAIALNCVRSDSNSSWIGTRSISISLSQGRADRRRRGGIEKPQRRRPLGRWPAADPFKPFSIVGPKIPRIFVWDDPLSDVLTVFCFFRGHLVPLFDVQITDRLDFFRHARTLLVLRRG